MGAFIGAIIGPLVGIKMIGTFSLAEFMPVILYITYYGIVYAAEILIFGTQPKTRQYKLAAFSPQR